MRFLFLIHESGMFLSYTAIQDDFDRLLKLFL